jgi:protein transport protein SEC20
MADDVQVPIQAKIQIREIVKLEFELQNLVQEIRQCDGPLVSLNDLNSKIKIKMNSLKAKVEVKKISFEMYFFIIFL